MTDHKALMIAETNAQIADEQERAAWFDWARVAVARGVRCDVSPRSLATLPRFVQVAPGVVVHPDGTGRGV